MHASAYPLEATYADLETVPDHLRGEIIDGELVVSPRPVPRHSRAATKLSSQICRPFDDGIDGPGGWWIFIEAEIRLDGEAFVPDIAGWRRETLPEFPETPAIEVAPDWICEVLSPSTERTDRLKKLAAYARHRVDHVWLVNPTHRTIEVYRREGDPAHRASDDRNERRPAVGRSPEPGADTWRLLLIHDGEKPLRIEPFDAVELAIPLIWAPERRAPGE